MTNNLIFHYDGMNLPVLLGIYFLIFDIKGFYILPHLIHNRYANIFYNIIIDSCYSICYANYIKK
jgi:hypothetical protein